MHAKLLLLCLCLVTFCAAKCHTVKQGAHYDDELFKGFRTEKIIKSNIQFQRDMSQYIFPPTDEKGHLCQSSWNKLYGASRCGFWKGPHDDSDRFVWRRDLSCFTFNGTRVISQKPNCLGIEVAAYAYDNGQQPFKHEGTLLKPFATILQPLEWYQFVIQFDPTSTTYQIVKNNTIVEEKQIVHRSCDMYGTGVNLGLYFGGQCPAPMAVSACYETVSLK